MLKRGLALVMSFAMASSALGGATVDLVVTDFGNTPCGGIDFCTFNPMSGPFYGGETILVHVMVTSDIDIALRGAQIDWRASSPELGLGQDIDAVNQPLDGIPNFWFDYSPIIILAKFSQGTYPATGIGPEGSTTGGYVDFSNLQWGDPLDPLVPATAWASPSPLPGMLELQAGVPFRLGGMPVTLPTEPGDYTLDVLNLANTNDSNFGMILIFGFGVEENDPVTMWSSAEKGYGVGDVITYANGPLMLTVIPEPTTLLFLAPAVALLAIRRSARVRADRA